MIYPVSCMLFHKCVNNALTSDYFFIAAINEIEINRSQALLIIQQSGMMKLKRIWYDILFY